VIGSDELSELVYEALQAKSNNSPRSLLSKDFRLGISDLGHCQEYTRRVVVQEPQTDARDVLQAFLGTAIGDHVEDAVAAAWPAAHRGLEVTAALVGDTGEYSVTGHPDLVVDGGGVIDIKTKDGLELVQRTGPTRQQLFQRHVYMKGLLDAGWFADIAPEDLWTANVWVDRSGATKRVVSHIDRYDPAIVRHAAEWLDEVIYAVVHRQEAMKEQPIEFCERYCEYFSSCRGATDREIGGWITDPEIREAVALYAEGAELERQGKRKRDEAKSVLLVPGGDGAVHLNGLTEQGLARAVWVNPVQMRPFERKGYWKFVIDKAPGRRPRKSD
jgi:hypothetical protein